MTVSYHFLKTRADQRKVTKALKAKGLQATNTSVKTAKGWQVNVNPIAKGHFNTKMQLSYCANSDGSLVSVLSKNILPHSNHPAVN